jgi:hypothetical protein
MIVQDFLFRKCPQGICRVTMWIVNTQFLYQAFYVMWYIHKNNFAYIMWFNLLSKIECSRIISFSDFMAELKVNARHSISFTEESEKTTGVFKVIDKRYQI